MKKTGLIPTNHIWHLERDQSLMLAEWPESLEEFAINESAVTLAEHANKEKFAELSPQELQVKIGEAVAKTAVKFTSFTTMQLRREVISHVANMSATRGKKKLEYSWDHITAKGGYTGGFYKYTEGVTLP